MAYEYEKSNKQIVYTVDNESSMDKLNERINELQEVYRKAKAFDEISKYVNQKLSAEVPINDDYLIGRFESYETIQEFMERADDERK